MSRGAWLLAAVALAFVATLLWAMGRALDTKAPVSLPKRAEAAEASTPTPLSPEEAERREEESMRALVVSQAPRLAARAAEQAFPADEVAGARCAFTSASLLNRDAASAYWRLDYACAHVSRPDALPNPVSLSVHVVKEERGWSVAP